MSRQNLDRLIDKAFWSLLLAVCTYVAGQAKSLNDNISSLNVKMATVVEHIAYQDKILGTHDKRLNALEKKR